MLPVDGYGFAVQTSMLPVTWCGLSESIMLPVDGCDLCGSNKYVTCGWV